MRLSSSFILFELPISRFSYLFVRFLSGSYLNWTIFSSYLFVRVLGLSFLSWLIPCFRTYLLEFLVLPYLNWLVSPFLTYWLEFLVYLISIVYFPIFILMRRSSSFILFELPVSRFSYLFVRFLSESYLNWTIFSSYSFEFWVYLFWVD